MNKTTHYEVTAQTKAGPVRGMLSLTLEGPVDGLAAVDEKLTRHLLSAPCEVKPAVVEPQISVSVCGHGPYNFGSLPLNGGTAVVPFASDDWRAGCE